MCSKGTTRSLAPEHLGAVRLPLIQGRPDARKPPFGKKKNLLLPTNHSIGPGVAYHYRLGGFLVIAQT